MAEGGADVAVLGRFTTDLEQVAADIRARGRRALAVTCDVTQTLQIDTACARIWPDGWQKFLDLNLTSTLLFSQRLGRAMAEPPTAVHPRLPQFRANVMMLRAGN